MAAAPAAKSPLDELKITYMNFVTFGDKQNAGLMNGKVWAKMCKDCKLIDKNLTSAIVDLVFNTIKPKGGRTITFKVFCEGLDKLGSYKYPADFKSGGAAATTPKLVELINKQKVPVSSGTKALANKFHDDKKLYTGVHAKGGPTTSDNKITLSNLANRAPANARGLNK
jgi:hypothetical protein